MASNYTKDDPVFGTIDLDDQYVTDSWLVNKYVGGTLFSWGYNSFGSIGNNSSTGRYSSPVQIGSLNNWKQVVSLGIFFTGSANYYAFSLATKTDGTLWSWGDNIYGNLGLNNRTNYSSPVQIGSLTTWKELTTSSDDIQGAAPNPSNSISAAISTNGGLWTWGRNDFGQLGNGNTTYYSSPVQVGTLTNWKQVTSGLASTAAIKTDGTLWVWGWNAVGQLGLGFRSASVYYSSPVQVGSLTNWKYVSMNRGSTFAVKTDGTLWSWGMNNVGQLGLGNTAYYSSPIQVGALTNWKQIVAASAGSTNVHGVMALKTDGTLWGWGSNNFGQLGNGNITNYSSPVQIGTLTNWKTIAKGSLSSAAIKTDGTLWVWGSNTYGTLGLGFTGSYYSSPVQVGALNNWKQVSVATYSMTATVFTDLN